MRVMPIAMLGLCLAACAARTLRIDDTGDPLDGGAHGAVDFATPVDLARSFDFSPPIDLAQPGAGCAQVLTCENTCTTQTCVDQCLKTGTPVAQKLFITLENCAQNACASACNDPMSQACNDCFTEIATGTGADGQSNGPCIDANMQPSMAPVCGRCVDELLSCESDQGM